MHPINFIIILPLTTFWLWMFWDMAGNDAIPPASKFNWVIAFVLLNVFAAGIYYAYFRSNRYR